MRRGAGRGLAWLKAHVDYHGDGCLIWPMSRRDNGYGQVGYNGKVARAHRVMCELVHGPAPTADHYAAHECGNGLDACVHPRHVFWKTPSENAQDRHKHGTMIGVNYWGRGGKLSRPEVAEIKRLKGKRTQIELATHYGVTARTIGKIHRGERRANVPVGA